MKKIIFAMLLFASPVWAGSYTITTTAQQDKAIAWIVAQYNIQRHNADPTWIDVTADAYLAEVVGSLFRNYVQQLQEANTTSALTLKQKYDNADPATQQQIDVLLQGK